MKTFREYDYEIDKQGYQKRIRHEKFVIVYDEHGFQRRRFLHDDEKHDPAITHDLPDVKEQ